MVRDDASYHINILCCILKMNLVEPSYQICKKNPLNWQAMQKYNLSHSHSHYRDIFSNLFPSPSAAETVPYGKSIACSSPAAIAWDAAFQNAADPSGRSVAGVHVSAKC